MQSPLGGWLSFRVGAPVQERVDALADRANEGLLSEDERTEMMH